MNYMKRIFAIVISLFSLFLFFISCEKAPFLALNDPTSISFTSFGGKQTVSFTTNRDWIVSSANSWCTVSPTSGSKSEEGITITITCEPNTKIGSRTTTLGIKADDLLESITVNQPPINPDQLFSSEPHFSESMDLISLIWRLIEAPEYNDCHVQVVNETADAFFASMISHEVLDIARECRNRGVGYDAVASFGLHLLISDDGVLSFNPFFVGDTDSSFNRWSDSQKKSMLYALNDFYKKSNFHEWYQSLEPLRQQAIDSFKKICNVDYKWFDDFFGPIEGLSTQILLSFLNGGSNYGCSVDLAYGGKLLSPVLGCIQQDRNGTPLYSDITDVIIHEFCHPYCNPRIDYYWESMAEKANTVFEQVKTKMSSMAYGNAKTMMCETFVRASTIRYLVKHGSKKSKENLIKSEESKGFLFVRTFVDALEKREKNMTQYPTIDSIMPEIIKAVNDYGP